MRWEPQIFKVDKKRGNLTYSKDFLQLLQRFSKNVLCSFVRCTKHEKTTTGLRKKMDLSQKIKYFRSVKEIIENKTFVLLSKNNDFNLTLLLFLRKIDIIYYFGIFSLLRNRKRPEEAISGE